MGESAQIDFLITPHHSLEGEIAVPGDKSISHRALLLAAIAEGHSLIEGLLMGADNIATLKALQQLGVEIITQETNICVKGVGLHGLQAPSHALDLGNSGTGMRLFAGLLAGQSFSSVLIGDSSLSRRPMRRVVEPLTQMGAKVQTSAEGTAPLEIVGGQNLHGIEYHMPIPSAQVKSCVLLAGLYARGITTIVEPLLSRNHLELMLHTFGYPGLSTQQVLPANFSFSLQGGKKLTACELSIPGDLSSAAFFIVAALITPGSELTIKNVGVNPSRTGVITVLKMMGADIQIDPKPESSSSKEPVADLYVRASSLHGIDIPRELVPSAIDEFPILFIAAACARGRTVLQGAIELRVKESDRIATMAKGLMELGVNVAMLEDGIIIEGGNGFNGGEVQSFGDHRVAMAFTIAGCVARAPVRVQDCANIETSFPQFVATARRVGIDIKTDGEGETNE